MLECKFGVDSVVFAVAVGDASTTKFDSDDDGAENDEADDNVNNNDGNDDDNDGNDDDDNADNDDVDEQRAPARAAVNSGALVDLVCRTQAHPRVVDGVGSVQSPDSDGYFYADSAQHWSTGYATKKRTFARMCCCCEFSQ